LALGVLWFPTSWFWFWRRRF